MLYGKGRQGFLVTVHGGYNHCKISSNSLEAFQMLEEILEAFCSLHIVST